MRKFTKKFKKAMSLFLTNAIIVSSCPTYALAEVAKNVNESVSVTNDSSDSPLDYVSQNGLSAIRIDSDSMNKPETIESWLVADGVKDSKAVNMATTLLRNTKAGEDSPDLERSGDGTNIESLYLTWITQDTVDNGDSNLLYLRPGDDSALQVRLRLNYALSGEFPYNAGDIRITVPADMFKDRNGEALGNMLVPYPEAPSMAQDFNYELVGNNIVITNTRKLSAATKGFIEFAITGLTPHKIPDMALSNDFTAALEVTTHLNNLIGLHSNVLTAQVDTEATLNGAYKETSGYPQWVEASAIPESQRVDGEDEYVVVTWRMYNHKSANTEFTVDALDEKQDEYDGFIIGSTENDGQTKTFDNMFTGYSSSGNGQYINVKVAYPGSQFEPNTEYNFSNKVTYTLTEVDPAVGDDPQKVTTKSHVATVSWSWHMPVFIEPSGHFMFNKIGNDGQLGHDSAPYWARSFGYNFRGYYKHLDTGFHNTDDAYGIYPSALNDLRDGESIELGYTIEPQGWTAKWTYDGDPRVIESYGKRPVTMITYDTNPRATGTLYMTGGEQLTWGEDWTYKAVEIPSKPCIGKLKAVNMDPNGEFIAVHAGDGKLEYIADTDDANQPLITLEAQVGDNWITVATIDYSNAAAPISVQNGSILDGSRVLLPIGTQRIRSSVQTTNAYLYYYLRPIVELHATDHVKTVVNDLFADSNTPNTMIYNTGAMDAYDADNHHIATFDKVGADELRGYSTDTAVYTKKYGTQHLEDVDYSKRQVLVSYSATVDERSIISDKFLYQQAVADGRIPQDTHGIFYDLLPIGMTPVMSTISLRKRDKIIDAYTVENWRDSGRTMLIVEAELEPVLSYYAYEGSYDNRVMDQLQISFKATYGFDALRDYGTSTHNVIAYESLSRDTLGDLEDYRGEADNPNGSNNITTQNAFKDDDEKSLFEDLDKDRDTESFVYAGVDVHIDALGVARTSLSKDVMVNNDGTWSQGTYNDKRGVYEGGQYSYRLRMMSNSDTVTRGIILYDSLENFEAGGGNDENDIDAPHWRGTLRSIDLTQLREMGVDPVVYYTTVDNIQIADEHNPEEVNNVSVDLSNPELWVEAGSYTGAMEDVHGIAIDCRNDVNGEPFELDEMQSIVAIVRMQAPSGDAAKTYLSQSGVWGDSANAYNNAYMICQSVDKNTMIESRSTLVRNDYTKVGLLEYSYNVVKAWDDDLDRDGIRPTEVTVHLLANGKDTGLSQVLNSDNDWSAKFENIPYSDEDGNTIRYTLSEDSVEGYDAFINKSDLTFNVRNDHDPEKTNVSGHKSWVDTPDDKLPEYIQVNLYGDDALVASKVVRPDGKGDWEYDFTGLNKYRNHGVLIDYRVEEKSFSSSFLTSYDGFNIINTYHPYGNLTLSKEVVGATPEFANREFMVTFMLNDADGVPVDGEFAWESTDGTSGTVFNGGELIVSNGETITIHEIPEYAEYEFIEAEADGYTVSGTGMAGTIVPNDTVSAELVNTYEANGTAQIQVNKALTGRDMTRYQFRFELLDESGVVVRTGSNQTNGTVTFGALKYTTEDAGNTYHYTIREVDRGVGGYTYDTQEYRVDVTVVDRGNGKLRTDVVYTNADDEVIDVPSFDNTYEADGSVRLRAWKRVYGAEIEEGAWSFEFLDENGDVVSSATNTANGDVWSDSIDFDEHDDGNTYLYVVHEVAGDDARVIYDDSYYGYLVDVVDNGDGTMSISQEYTAVAFDDESEKWVVTDDDAEVPVFTNRLQPGSLKITKQVVGDVPEANQSDEFRFKVQLVGEDIPENIEYDIRKLDVEPPSGSVVIPSLFDSIRSLFEPTVAYASEDDEFTVTYDANGGHFGNDTSKTSNDVLYGLSSDGETGYSYTANLDANGNQISMYENNSYESYIRGTNRNKASSAAHVVTIPGARSITVTVTYNTYNSYDYVRIWSGQHPDYSGSFATSNAGFVASLYGSRNTVTYVIPGDSVTFTWYTNNTGASYGYYAEVTECASALDSVLVPVRNGYTFVGWNTLADGSGDLVDSPTDSCTLYAQWSNDIITFDANGGIFESNGLSQLNVHKVSGGPFGQVISHSDNVKDNGSHTTSYRTGHSTREYQWDVVQIPGATNLKIEYQYGTYNYYDTLYVSRGSVAQPSTTPNGSGPSISNSIFYSYYYTSGSQTYNTTGDTVTFGLYISPSSSFTSINGKNDLGWYAKVTSVNTVVDGDTVEVPKNRPYRFIGWNTAEDGSGNWYTDGSDTMYAQWEYNGGTCGGVSYYVDGNNTLVFYPTNGVSGEFERPSDGHWPWENLLNNNQNVKSVYVEPGVIGCSDMSYFLGRTVNTTVTSIDARNMDTSHVTNMARMFSNLESVKTLRVDGWDTSQVTDMGYIFYDMRALTRLDLHSWDVSNVVNMASMYNYMRSLVDLNIDGWDTQSVRDFSNWMRYSNSNGCSLVDFTTIDTSSATTMEGMFCDTVIRDMDVSTWDVSHVTNMSYMFYNGPNYVKGISEWDTSSVTNMSFMFYNRYIYANEIAGLDTQNVTNMAYMFGSSSFYDDNNQSVKTLDLTMFDVSSVRDMSSMFYGATQILYVDIAGWNTSNVTNMCYMFSQSGSSMNGVWCDLSEMDVEHVTNFSYMLYNNSSFKTVDISSWDMSRATNTDYFIGTSVATASSYAPYVSRGTTKIIFGENCKIAKTYASSSSIGWPGQSVDGTWVKLNDPDNVRVTGLELTNLYSSDNDRFVGTWIVGNQQAVAVLDKTGVVTFVTPNAPIDSEDPENTIMTITSVGGTQYTGYVDVDYIGNNYSTRAYVFNGKASQVKKITVDKDSEVHFILPTGLYSLFNSFSNLETFEGERIDVSNQTTLYRTFYGDSKLVSADFTGWDTSHVTSMEQTFYNDYLLREFDPTQLDTSSVTNMNQTFCSCRALPDVDFTEWDVSKVTTMYYMFYDCDTLENPDFSTWNPANVTNLSYMFYSCDKLDTPSFKDWNMPKAQNMSYMFAYARGPLNLDVFGWNTPNVTNMSYMFSGCSGATNLDLTGLDTGSVTTMAYMFNGMNKLETINISGFDTSNVTDMQGMFRFNYKLEELDVSNFDVSKVVTFGYNGANSYEYGTFYGCSAIKELDLSAWVPSSAQSFSWMFGGMTSLEKLDISNFGRGHANTYRYSMFNGDKNLRSVTIGSDFEFASDSWMNNKNSRTSSPYPYYATILPTPPSGTTTGRWVNLEKDDTRGLTPEALRITYDGTDESMVGTWVWQMAQLQFVFDANGGMGRMPNQIIAKSSSDLVNPPTFTLFDHDFVEWNTKPDGSGISYQALQQVLVNNTELNRAKIEAYGEDYATQTESYTDGTDTITYPKITDNVKLTLYAQWKQRDHSINLEDGAFYVNVPIDSELVINNLPSGVGYVVTEVGATQSGWTLDSQEGGSGKISSLQTDEAVFTNRYTPDETQAIITANKLFNGEAPESGLFDFELVMTDSEIFDGNDADVIKQRIVEMLDQETASDDDWSPFVQAFVDDFGGELDFESEEFITYLDTIVDNGGITVATTSNVDGGGVVFDPITYTTIGTYEYVIREVAGNDTTVDYDDATYPVTVNVTRDSDNIMTSRITYSTINGNAPVFMNATKPGSLTITKAITGVRAEDAHDTFEATVVLKRDNGSFVTSATVNGTKVNSSTGIYTVNFTDETPAVITDIPANSTYELSETSMPAGWSQVSIDHETGTIASNQNSDATITNNYLATGEATIQVWKRLNGRVITSGEFSFELLDDTDNVIETVQNSVADTRETIVDTDGETSIANPHRGDALATFSMLTYDTPGEYHYTVREVTGTDASVDYDPSVVGITVTVTDIGNGNLSTSVSYTNNDDLFENTVVPGSLRLIKSLHNETDAAKDTEFTYHVTLRDRNGQLVPDATYEAIRNNQSETVSFVNGVADINMKATDEVTIIGLAHDSVYTVTETMPACWHEYDSVTTTGTIVRETVAEATFVNEYEAHGDFTLGAKKRVENLELQAGDYTFVVKDSNGVEVSRATNDADGNIVFDTLPLYQSWIGTTQTYTISELTGDDSRITYDSHVETVTIQTIDDGNGNLSAQINYDDDDAVFVNAYNPSYIKLIKTCSVSDLNDNPNYDVAGAVYELLNNDGGVVQEIVIGEGGTSETVEVDPGTYYVKEKTAPIGFAVDTVRHRVTVVGGQERTVELTDDPLYGSIALVKVSDKPEITVGRDAFKLDGAIYGVYTTREDAEAARDGNVEPVATITTENRDDWTGYGIVSDLPKGTYYVTELKAPRNYKLDTTIYECDVDYDSVARVNGGTVTDEVAAGFVTIVKRFG